MSQYCLWNPAPCPGWGNCPDNEEEFKFQHVSLGREWALHLVWAAFIHLGQLFTDTFPSLSEGSFKHFVFTSRLFPCVVCFHAAKAMSKLNADAFNLLFRRFLFSCTLHRATPQLCKMSWWSRTLRADPTKVLPAAELAAGPGWLCPPWRGYAESHLGRIYVALHFIYQGRHYCKEQISVLKATWKLLLKIE